MDMIRYSRADRPEGWLEQIGKSDWRAGQFLHRLLAEDRFHEMAGQEAEVLLLADGDRLAAFCTYAEKDDIPETDLAPWAGFVYTFPEYRGRRLMGKLLAKAREMAREDGYEAIYISTGETGLYEKYGAEFLAMLKDRNGEDSRIYRMDTYGFAGWQGATVKAEHPLPGIETPRDLYNALWHVWSAETCAPRMRKDWSEDNRTLGQCSVTAFLAQDLFGGKVYGVPLGDGSFHCYNVKDGCTFDLTSEQFGGRPMEYENNPEQSREVHFAKQEKRERYEMLKEALYRRMNG